MGGDIPQICEPILLDKAERISQLCVKPEAGLPALKSYTKTCPQLHLPPCFKSRET